MAIMGLDEAKNLQRICQPHGVEIILNHNEATCRRGCSTTVEVHAKETDIEAIQKIYAQYNSKHLKGLDFDVEQINSVYDPEKDKATCPACGCEFSTGNKECPDCGLAFG